MSIMIFMFLCFSGLVVMFYFIMRSQEKFYESMRDEHAQMRVMLRVMESKLADLAGETPDAPARRQDETPTDPLLNLSMNTDRQADGQDNGLELRFDPREDIRR